MPSRGRRRRHPTLKLPTTANSKQTRKFNEVMLVLNHHAPSHEKVRKINKICDATDEFTVRLRVAALAAVGSQEAWGSLRRLCKSPREDIRFHAVRVAGFFTNFHVLPGVVKVLKARLTREPSKRVKLAAVDSLVNIAENVGYDHPKFLETALEILESAKAVNKEKYKDKDVEQAISIAAEEIRGILKHAS
jgi:HEAT repeat protein